MTGGDDAPNTSIFDPATGGWLPKQHMNIARGYQVIDIGHHNFIAMCALSRLLNADPAQMHTS